MSDETSKPAHFTDYVVEMKESGRALAFIWGELVGDEGRKLLKKMFVVIVASTFLLSLQPLVFAKIIKSVQLGSFEPVVVALCILLATATLQHVVSLTQQLIREKTWNRIMFSMQVRINELFYEKSLGQHSEEGSTLNYSSIDRAKNRIQSMLEMILFETGSMLVYILFSYLLLWYLSPLIGLIATVLVIGHTAWSLYLNYHVSTETDEIEKGFRAHGRQLIERWEKIGRVKTSGKTRLEHARLAKWYDEILHKDMRFWFWFIKQAMFRDAIVLLARVSIIGYGTYLVYIRVWNIAMLVPLYSWITDLTSNLGWIGHSERRINQQVPYIKAMRDALMISPAFLDDEGIPLTHTTPIKVTFDAVGLSYGEAGAGLYPILQDLSFTINPGEKVALIGPSGAGKTSVMKLLLRYMDPTTGTIMVNGNQLSEVQLSSWMSRVGYISQQSQVFDGTIRYNLTFGLSEERQAEITDGEIWEVMKSLQVDFGARLTDGLQTRVGKDGMKLSGGQAQRLMIAAAVIKKPIFMVIDEATSSLDSTTEKAVQEGLEQVLAGPVGALIVAHRLSTVRKMCNRFIVLRPLEHVSEGGSQIEAEANSFEELYRVSPTFRRLADDQHISI